MPRRVNGRYAFLKSIRFNLLLLMAVISIPFCVILIVTALDWHDDIREDLNRDMKSLVLSICFQQENLVAGAQQLLSTLAQLPDLEARRETKLNALLSDILNQNAQYSNIMIANPDGMVFAAGLPLKKPVSLADRKFFSDVMKSGQFSPGEFVIGKSSKKPIINFGYPVKGDDGRITAVIAVGLDLTHLNKVFNHFALPPASNAALIDHRGIVLNRIQEPEKFIGKPAIAENFRIMIEGPVEGSFQGIGLEGIRKVFHYKKLFLGDHQKPYLYALVAVPTETMFNKANKEMAWYLTGFIGVFLAALVGTLLIAKFTITNKVEALQHAINSLAAGTLSEKAVEKVNGGEIGLLAEAFDAMHEQLKAKELEREKATEDLLGSHQRLFTVLSGLDAFVYVVDPASYQILFANATFLNKYGEVEGETCWRVIHAGRPGPCEQCLAPDDTGLPWEYHCSLDNRWYAVHDRLIQWMDGHTVRMVIATDVTERKRLEQELLHSQKMESIGRLAGGVAHDFNNMLSVILGHAEMGLLRLNPAHPVTANLTEIGKAAQRSADLTRQLLAFARKQTIAPKVLDLNDTISGMLKMLQRLIGEDIQIVWHPASELWAVNMDPSQIDQILANLCVNARDAITDTGTVRIETLNVVLDNESAYLMNAKPGGYVKLSLTDNGCGMDQETLARVFEPFFTTKGPGKGTGMGLATVFGAVQQNNGYITVDSHPKHGTTFAIFLPRHTVGATSQIHEGDVDASAPGGHETVLLVEDDLATSQMATEMLAGLGYSVLTVNTPSEAIQVARERTGKIDLLLTDVVMPDMNGRMLADRLLSAHPDLRLLFMSGYTADIIANRGVLDEGVLFIQKPFSMYSLAIKVREALEHS